MFPTQERQKTSFFRSRLSLDTRPYGREVYSKALSTIYISSLLLGVGVIVIYEIFTFSGYAQAGNLVLVLGSAVLYIFFVYFSYKTTALRIEDVGDKRLLAWLTIIPFVNLLFHHIYLIRPGKGEMVTSSSPFREGKPTKGRMIFASFAVSVVMGVLMSFYFIEETNSTFQGIAWGVSSALLVGGVVMFMLLSSRGKK